MRVDVYKEQSEKKNEDKLKSSLKKWFRMSPVLKSEEKVVMFLRKYWLPIGFFLFIFIYMILFSV